MSLDILALEYREWWGNVQRQDDNGRFRCGQINISLALTDIGPSDGGPLIIIRSQGRRMEHPIHGLSLGICLLAILSMAAHFQSDHPAMQPQSTGRKPGFTGPLRVLKSNPRYFTDDAGKAIYLTGAHTWSNLQDMGDTAPPKPFDYAAYLDFLHAHYHNFIRLWRWELPSWTESAGKTYYCVPQPWKRIGPGLAHDGKPRFNLRKFNDVYFRRLRERIVAARDRGIYVSLMLFEGWGMQFVA